jgi:hypothetical protein
MDADEGDLRVVAFCFGFACKLQAETLGNSGGSLINKRVGKPDMDRDTRHSSLGCILV